MDWEDDANMSFYLVRRLRNGGEVFLIEFDTVEDDLVLYCSAVLLGDHLEFFMDSLHIKSVDSWGA
ncbi:hypothetical protein [Halomonas rhizosphaerae]|uniref:Uncharacterized protein n=1 Tax=Halomonas rhizosphaerae TaxID=3043296 RepID=A0ABT6V2W9_9GAMM|nr:hypothetical protein [Halomonas rhizosphaerae]MDI5891843.1 hypothetical protein [Halomonas rhizosphaerae]